MNPSFSSRYPGCSEAAHGQVDMMIKKKIKIGHSFKADHGEKYTYFKKQYIMPIYRVVFVTSL